MSEPRKEAIAFNNLGVEFFLRHRLQEAATLFDGAIQRLAMAMDLDCSSEVIRMKETEATLLYQAYELSAPNLPQRSNAAQSSTKAYLLQRVRSQPDPNIRSSMFMNAFRVVNDDTTIENDKLDHHELRIMAGISMFNRGLCHHMSAGEVSDHVAHSQEVAAMLYTLAYEVASPLSSGSPIPARLVMVALNNLALLHHEVGQYEQSQQYLDMLHNFLLQGKSVQDEEFQSQRARCMLNTMLLKPPTTAASA